MLDYEIELVDFSGDTQSYDKVKSMDWSWIQIFYYQDYSLEWHTYAAEKIESQVATLLIVCNITSNYRQIWLQLYPVSQWLLLY